eukprot:TRINITY_DN61907_c0_g1_i1.p1 TRINITY_DN61907_c0_g1~~TRINITY_DN61907_c0_g1_i1.p1  ORF type:complete len:372 (-),score=62.60 TRINITY_DN61907_c0_g1_i1:84-1199(-)
MTSAIRQLFSRWFALLSGVFATLAWKASYEILGDTSNLDVKKAAIYTVCMLAVFALIAALSFQYKKQLDAASQAEKKDGMLDMTPSELVALTVDEGISNLTSAMASMLAGLWFSFVPSMSSMLAACVFLGSGCTVLLLGEAIQRLLQKGTGTEYIVSLLNGLNVGSVSWWVGYPLSNFTQSRLGGAPGESAEVEYWMWGVALLLSAINMEILSYISLKLPKGSDGKVYGALIVRTLKGVPLYSSGIILYNITQYRYGDMYLVGTLIWLGISSVAVVLTDHLLHMPGYKLSPARFYAEEKVAFDICNDAVTLLGQTLAYTCGQLGGSALVAMVPGASVSLWIIFALAFQLFSIVLQEARTRCLPAVWKEPGT